MAATYRVPTVRVMLVRDKAAAYSVPRAVNYPENVAHVARQAIGDAEREHLCVMGLDGNNRIVAVHFASIGVESSFITSMPCILRAVLLMGVARFVLAHNHPSGDCCASAEDKIVTSKLAKAAKLVGLILLDHVIVSENEFFSFADAGLLSAAGEDADRKDGEK